MIRPFTGMWRASERSPHIPWSPIGEDQFGQILANDPNHNISPDDTTPVYDQDYGQGGIWAYHGIFPRIPNLFPHNPMM